MGTPGVGVIGVTKPGKGAIKPNGKLALFTESGNACDCCDCSTTDVGFCAPFVPVSWMQWERNLTDYKPAINYGGSAQPQAIQFENVAFNTGAFVAGGPPIPDYPTGIIPRAATIVAKTFPPVTSYFYYGTRNDILFEVTLGLYSATVEPLDPFCEVQLILRDGPNALLMIGRHYAPDQFIAAAPYFGTSFSRSMHSIVHNPGWSPRTYTQPSTLTYRREWTNIRSVGDLFQADVIHTLILNGVNWRGPDVQFNQYISLGTCPTHNPSLVLWGTNSPYPFALNGNRGSEDRAYNLTCNMAEVHYNGLPCAHLQN